VGSQERGAPIQPQVARAIASRTNDTYPGAMPPERTPSRKRSVVKALTYRVFIVVFDFVAIYLFTRKVEVALGFMIVSNIYTTVAYFLHERLWARIRWGTEPKAA
jgi:adenylylsulfate kinase